MGDRPTFLFCLGATKAGTSWLYDHLAAHSDCHFRTIKELHYFGLTTPADFDGAVRKGQAAIAELKERIAGLTGAAREAAERELADRRHWQRVLRRREIDLDAYRDYLLVGRNGQAVVGDVTPAYSLLPEERLALLSQAGGEGTRALYLMRDPVARVWSHVRMIAQRTRATDVAAKARALLRRMLSGDMSGEGQGIADRGDYAAIVPRLARAFDPSRLLVMFYEDLMSLPGIARLSAFLGISVGAADFDRRVHKGTDVPMNDEDRRAARSWLRPQYDFVSGRFADMPQAWRVNMEEGLA